MNIQDDCVVAIHYKLMNDEGEVLDSSEGREPLTYLHGHRAIVSGLERALTGKAAGDVLEVTVPPEEGYGEINPELFQTVPRSAFGAIEELVPGMPLQADDGKGNVYPVVVREIRDDEVVIDINHPLAGKMLHFSVTVESVRKATPDELAHGHVH